MQITKLALEHGLAQQYVYSTAQLTQVIYLICF